MCPNQSAQKESGGPFSTALAPFLAGLASQVVIIGALLYYFGWVTTQATYTYFGVDTSLLNFNTIDYMLRSANVAFPALAVASIAIIAALNLDQAVLRYLSGRQDDPSFVRHARFLPHALKSTAVILGGLALVDITMKAYSATAFTVRIPLLLLAGSIIFIYSIRVSGINNNPPSSDLRYLRQLQYHTTLSLALIAVVWILSIYAVQAGRQTAVNLARGIRDLPAVFLYTTQRQAISGSGVNAAEIDQAGTKYRYQYSGLRLLLRSGDRLFLIPVRWQHNRDSVIIIRESDDVRANVTTQ